MCNETVGSNFKTFYSFDVLLIHIMKMLTQSVLMYINVVYNMVDTAMNWNIMCMPDSSYQAFRYKLFEASSHR